jgi:ferritin-like protein
MASEDYHEDPGSLEAETVERHRAIVSLMEELEAVDWYQQRIDATQDQALKAILAHNRDEEKEHAAMLVEWLRRHDEELARQLRNYLFTHADITAVEEGAVPAERADDGSLGIGSLQAGEAGA